MKKQSQMKRMLSLLLVLAFVIGLFPTAALAAGSEEELKKFKAMQMVNLRSNSPVSVFEFENSTNTFYDVIDLNSHQDGDAKNLVKLFFTIQSSQNVSLELYKLGPVNMETDGNGRETTKLLYDENGNPEPFLGEFIGYIYGTHITDNVVESPAYPGIPLEDAPEVGASPLSRLDWFEIIQGTLNGAWADDEKAFINQYVYGFDGVRLAPQFWRFMIPLLNAAQEEEVLPPEEASTPQEETAEEMPAPEEETTEETVKTGEKQESPIGLNPIIPMILAQEEAEESEKAIEEKNASEEAAAEGNTAEAVAQEETPATEEATEGESASRPSEDEALVMGTEADVLIDRSVKNSLGFSLFAIEDVMSKLQNFILWDGRVVADENSEAFFPDYEDGLYVIVMQPSSASVSIYNSFLAFEMKRDDQQNAFSAAFLSGELEAWNKEFCNAGDPVELLTGSFRWNYTDTALYGKHNLEFIRYYQSKVGDQNFDLGMGWSSNYTAKLVVDPLYVKAILPDGKEMYFPLQFDETYAPAGDYSLERVGNEYRLTKKDQTVYLFNEAGLATSVNCLNGNAVTLEYDGDKLSRISNKAGSFDLRYNADGNLETVRDSVGRVTEYAYRGDYLVETKNTDGDSLRYGYDAKGYLDSVTNFKGQVYVENTFDDSGRVVYQYAKDIGTFSFTYDGASRTNTCTGLDGSYLMVKYDKLGRPYYSETSDGARSIEINDLNQITSETDRVGNTSYYDHDEEGNISMVTYPDGTTDQYAYNENRQVESVIDRNGVEVRNEYDSGNNMTGMTDGRGNRIGFTYDSDNNMISATTAEGATTTFTYDGVGNMLTETDADGNTTHYTYDEQGRLVKKTDAKGNETHYEYTNAGKLLKLTDPDGNVLRYTIDGNGFSTSESDWMGNITAFERNTQNQVIRMTDSTGVITTYSYDDSGNLVVSTDGNGNTTSYTYDVEGRMIAMTTASGGSWSYGYDANGRQISMTDPNGGTSTTTYNAIGRVTESEDQRGAVTQYSYDGVGNSTQVKDALGNVTRMGYDENGNLVSRTDRNGDTTTFIYDKSNRMTQETDALGQITQYVYDDLGNLMKTTTPEGSVSGFQYDELNRQTSVHDALSRAVSTRYDALGRVIETKYADGSSVSYTYDANGRVLTSTNELGDVMSYSYDSKGQVLTSTDPMGGVTSYTYDAEGNILTTKTPMGFETTRTYNESNSIATITDAEGYMVSYTYDEIGRVQTITDANGGVTSYTYDPAGNTSTVTDAEGGVVSYEYDLLGRQTAVTDARGNCWMYEYDNEGNQTEASDPLGNYAAKSYDAIGQLVSEVDKNGNVWSYTYDKDGRITAKTDPLGNITSYQYDAVGNLLSTTTSMGRSTSSTYDARDRQTGQTDPMGHAIILHYDDLGRMVGMENKDGTEVSWTYDANGNNLTVTDEEGYVVSYVYDADGRMTSLANARGYTTSYEYDKVGNLISAIDALNGRTSSVYDGKGNLVSETDALGNATTYTYDKLGRVIATYDVSGGTTSVAYDANGNVTKITDGEGNVITYTYDILNRLSGYVDSEGYAFSYIYDGNGNVLTEADGNGNVTHYAYDGLDRVVGMTDGDGGVSTKTYDADGRLIQVVNEEGAETNYVYDDCSRVIQMTDALGNETTYTYDEMDRVLTITDARGGVTSYTYTDRGAVETETDAEGYVTSFKYDENQNRVKETTIDGDTIYVYDALDRLISTTTPDGKEEWTEYDALGRVTAVTDKGGHKTQYIYDAAGNVIQTIDATGHSAYFAYDKLGNLTKTTLHRVDTQDKADEWEITLYEYDGRGLVTKVVDALSNVTIHEYDGNGNLKKTTDADGYVTQYAYNGLDLVTNINYNGGKEVSYQYNAVGDLVEMRDWMGITSYEVNLLSRITQVSEHKGNVVQYQYDEVGNQTTLVYPDKTKVTKTYDLVNNLKTVTETDGRTTTYEYDGMGRVTHMDYPDGWQEDYTYDAIGQLRSIKDTDPTQKDLKQQKNVFQYDDCGNMVYEYMRGNGTGEATTEVFYTYDALNQVIQAEETYGSATRSYQYDSLGNLTYEWNSNNETWDYKLNNLNQITLKTDGKKDSYYYNYDGRGNQTEVIYEKNKKQSVHGAYIFDETNKMVSGTNDAGEVSNYVYNGLGALVRNEWIVEKNGYGYHSVTAPGETLLYPSTIKNPSVVVKEFVVDYTRETMDPLYESEVNGLDYRYVYGNERLSVTVKGVENGAGKLIENGNEIRLYYHQDLRGTIDYLTSPQSQKMESWTHYNEWGEITHNAVLKCGNRQLDLVKNYTGHDYDQVLDLYYAKARMYDPADRRFIAMDPFKGDIATPITLVQYVYCANNPLIHTDPLGLCYFENGKWTHHPKEYMSGTELKEDPSKMVLVQGAKGYAVSELQKLLVKYGYLSSNKDVDGSFGPATDKAVRAFQKANGLDVDGSVGPKTWKKLLSKNVVYASGAGTGTEISETPESQASNTTTYPDSLIFKSKRRAGKNEDGTGAADLKSGDYTRDMLREDIGGYWWWFGCAYVDAADGGREFQLWSSFRGLASRHAKGELRDVALRMIDHFEAGTGAAFSDPILTKHAEAHATTQEYIRVMKELAAGALPRHSGDITKLLGDTVLYDLIEKTAKFPRFNTEDDRKNGLKITVNDTWGNEVYIANYSVTGKSYKGTMRFHIYDHFGLDQSDVEKKYSIDTGFVSWFILQHYDLYEGKYKPFITVIDIDVPFEGRLQ